MTITAGWYSRRPPDPRLCPNQLEYVATQPQTGIVELHPFGLVAKCLKEMGRSIVDAIRAKDRHHGVPAILALFERHRVGAGFPLTPYGFTMASSSCADIPKSAIRFLFRQTLPAGRGIFSPFVSRSGRRRCALPCDDGFDRIPRLFGAFWPRLHRPHQQVGASEGENAALVITTFLA
jgi:hypothetical protein